MRFRFRFERVLDFRKGLERDALLHMAGVREERDRQMRTLAALKDESRRTGERYRSLRGGSTKMENLRRLKERLGALREDIAREQKTLYEWEAKLDEARTAWTETRKARKVLESLKEREFRAFVKRADKAEAALLDEVALRPFVLKAAADK